MSEIDAKDMHRMTLRLPAELHKQLSKAAAAKNLAFHPFIVMALTEYLQQQKKK